MNMKVGLILTVLITTACYDRTTIHETPDIREEPTSTRPGPREIVAATWDTVFRLGGTETDTLLYRPGYLEAAGADLYLYDSGRYQVARLTRTGELTWWFGGQGRGPDEFSFVRDLELDGLGNLWLLDVENMRITVLDPGGTAVRRIPLGDIPRPDRVLPVIDRGAMLLTNDASAPLLALDLDGRVLRTHRHPWDEWSSLSPLAAQSIAAADAVTGRFAIAFSAGNGFFVFENERPYSFLGAFVEHIEFPRVEVQASGNTRTERIDRPTFSAAAMDLKGDRLYVRFSGRSEHRGRLIDIYQATTGCYLKSVVLPRRVDEIAVSEGVVYALYDTPYPALAAWSSPALD